MNEETLEEAIRCMIKPHDALEDVLYSSTDNKSEGK